MTTAKRKARVPDVERALDSLEHTTHQRPRWPWIVMFVAVALLALSIYNGTQRADTADREIGIAKRNADRDIASAAASLRRETEVSAADLRRRTLAAHRRLSREARRIGRNTSRGRLQEAQLKSMVRRLDRTIEAAAAAGVKGLPGKGGAPGLVGVPGLDGATGPEGPKGDTGPPGSDTPPVSDERLMGALVPAVHDACGRGLCQPPPMTQEQANEAMRVYCEGAAGRCSTPGPQGPAGVPVPCDPAFGYMCQPVAVLRR